MADQTPRLVPDRPSDAAIAQAFYEAATDTTDGAPDGVGILWTINRAREIDDAAPPAGSPADRGGVSDAMVDAAIRGYSSADVPVWAPRERMRSALESAFALAAAPAAPAEGDIDTIAMEVARRFTQDTEPQRRASLQCAVIEAIRKAAPRVTVGREAIPHAPAKAREVTDADVERAARAYLYDAGLDPDEPKSPALTSALRAALATLAEGSE